MSPSRATPPAPASVERETRSAVLDAAAERFARFGPRKTTMEEVARTAGVSRATVYAHFGSKDALYEALLDRATQEFVGAAEACIDAPGRARRKLRRVVELAREAYAGSPVLLGAVTDDDEMRIAGIAAEAVGRHEARVIALLERVLTQGIEMGEIRALDPRATAYLMYHLGNVLVVREVSGRRDFPFRRILDAMDDLINHGLAKTRPRRRREA